MAVLNENPTAGSTGHIAAHAELRTGYLARGTGRTLPVYTATSTAADHAAIHSTLHGEHNTLGAATTLPTSLAGSSSGNLAWHAALHKAHNLRESSFQPRPYAPVGASKPLALSAQSDVLAANITGDVSNIGWIQVNGKELGRLPGWRAQNPDMVVLFYAESSFTKAYEYQQDYGPGNPMVQPWSWVKYPTTGVAYGQAIGDGGPVREDWFIHSYGTSATPANRMQSVAFAGAYLMNVGNVDYQNAWAENIIRFCQEWGFDGVMADDLLADLTSHAGTGTNCSLEWPGPLDCQPAFQSFLANVGPKMRAAGLHLVPNLSDAWRIGDSIMQTQWCNNVAGFMFEHISMGSADVEYINPNTQITHLQYIRNCQVAGAYAVTVCYRDFTDKKAMRCARATLEMARDSSKRTAMAFQSRGADFVEDNIDSRDFTWTVPLGTAVAAEQTVGSNGNQAARTRRLTNGFVALNPATGVAQTITCPVAGTRMSNGAAIAAGATFTLQPDDAEIVYL